MPAASVTDCAAEEPEASKDVIAVPEIVPLKPAVEPTVNVFKLEFKVPGVNTPEPVIFKVVNAASLYDIVVAFVKTALIVVKATLLSVIKPMVPPPKFKVSVVCVGVAKPLVSPNVPVEIARPFASMPVPDSVNVFKAFDEIVEFPKFCNVTAEIVAGNVELPLFKSLMVTALLAIPP